MRLVVLSVRLKAILCPSGDHSGSLSEQRPGWQLVSCCNAPVAVSTVQSESDWASQPQSSDPLKAIRELSGDQLMVPPNWVAQVPHSVSRRGWPASASVT